MNEKKKCSLLKCPTASVQDTGIESRSENKDLSSCSPRGLAERLEAQQVSVQ